MAWSALEQLCSIKYSLKMDPGEKINKLGNDPAFIKALQHAEKKLGQSHPFRPIYDTRTTSRQPKKFLFSSPAKAMMYLYQIRNNITHRGKGGYDEDVPIIDASLDILSKTIKNLLTIKE